MTRIENMAEETPAPESAPTGPQTGSAGVEGIHPSVAALRQTGYIVPRITDQLSETAKAIQTIVNQLGANPSSAEYSRDPQEKPPTWWPKKEDGEIDVDGWKKLDIKDRTVQAAVLVMRHFYDMPNTERAEAGNVEKFNAAHKDFAEYALGKKLYKWSDQDEKDTRIIAVELELENFDETKIKEYETDPVKQEQIRDVLNRLDFREREKVGIQNGRTEYEISDQTTIDDHPPHVSKDQWKRYLARPTQIEKELKEVEQELVSLTNQGFVDERKRLKTTVEAKIKELKTVIEKEDKDKRKGIQVNEEQLKLEQELEERFLLDTEIPLDPNNPFAKLPVKGILEFIEKGGDPNLTNNVAFLEQANKALEWNFHQARKLGIFEDLEERLEGRYQELALSLFSRSRVDQGDMDMETRRGSRNLTFAEAKEIIAKESDEHNLNSLTNIAELDASWKQLIRDGVISREGVNRFKGIRKAFVSGAYDQLYDSLSNLHYKRLLTEDLKAKLDQQLAQGTITRQRYDRLLGEVNIQRVSGEWDVRKLERDVEGKLDMEERAQEDKLFYVDRYYLTLTGTTEAQVEQGVNNYLTSLLEGARVYDVQTIMQKMQYLSAAIMSKKDILMQFGMSASVAQDALTRINILAENRGEFYVMNFVASHLMMDEAFVPLYEKWGGVIGIDKLKRVLDMNNGLVAPAMLLFLDPKNRLLFQPAGFKGQGMKNIWTQRTLREKIKEQLAEELVNYQARKVTPTELMEQTTWQDFLRMKFEKRWDTKDEQGNKKYFKPKEEVVDAKKKYDLEYDRVKKVDKAGTATDQDLDSLRKAREEYVKLQNQYNRLLVEAKSAVENTWRVFNVFGESARLGAPSIIMDNGDHINIEDATYFYKFAILDAIARTKGRGDNEDSLARMRWRAYQWTKNPWKYKDGKPIVEEKEKDKDGNMVVKNTFTLVKGLEDTGITPEVFTEFLKAAKELWTNGYTSVLKSSSAEYGIDTEHSFEEIINRNDVRPVRNNFISNYKSSREIFANLTAMREAKKGRQPFIKNILERLDQSGRGKFTALDRAKIKMGKDEFSLETLPDEKLKELFEDAITDSFIFHITARQLARWEATFKPEIEGQFSTDRLYYGSQDIPWGVKRLQYLPEYWMTNKRERIGRAWKLLPFIPLLKSGLAQECDTENLPELIMNVNKEHIDEPGLKQTAAGYKDAQGWRQRGETSVDEQRGETNWSFWDKPTVDSAQILKLVPQLPQKDGKNLHLEDYIKDPNLLKSYRIPYNFRKELVDVTREILKREAPLNVFLEAQLGYNRSAGGSGIGLEMGERMHYRKFQWWLSEEEDDIEHKRGTEGGLLVNDDAAQFLKFVTIKNSWSDGMSIFDEAWRQARGTRDAGASDKFPKLTIVS